MSEPSSTPGQSARVKPVIARPDGRRRETWDDAARGNASWFTLFSSEITPTAGMSAGILELPPRDGRLDAHRHPQAELYFIVAGTAALSIESAETVVTAGDAVFVPGGALHALRNDGDAALRVFYVFPTDSFAEIVYEFVELAGRPGQSLHDR